ncbi:hypothetical protein GCM10028792_08260 [Salinisphaera aquimarina]
MLAQISRLDAPTMGELARALVLDRSALAHNIKPLERDGYLTITPDPQDKRTRRVSLTARGEAKLEQSIALWEDAQQRFESVFGATQAQELRRTLALISSSRFVEAFEQAEPDDYSGD